MESYDSLPYIDQEITEAERSKAEKQIRKELSSGRNAEFHPSVRSLPEVQFSPLIQTELERCAQGKAFSKGIDLTRYEAPDDPLEDSDIATWRNALRNAYTSSTYLASRRVNLQLLEEFGKNAWLIGNAQLEAILKNMERELEQITAETTEVNRARKLAQESSKGELLALDETWRKGIAQMIEVQVATEQMKAVLAERRRMATG